MTRTALPSRIAVSSAGNLEGERAQEQLAASPEVLTNSDFHLSCSYATLSQEIDYVAVSEAAGCRTPAECHKPSTWKVGY
jgi:hypothetical protein